MSYSNDNFRRCSIVPVEKSELPIRLPSGIDPKVSGNPLENHPTWKKTIHKKTGKPATS